MVGVCTRTSTDTHSCVRNVMFTLLLKVFRVLKSAREPTARKVGSQFTNGLFSNLLQDFQTVIYCQGRDSIASELDARFS